jgi:predicted NBD/HSP70 family sugar kinase
VGNTKGRIDYNIKTCPQCGRVGQFHTYCSGACKQKAWRERKEAKFEGECRTVDSYLAEDFERDDYQFIIDALNCVTGKANAHAVNDAIMLMIQVYHSKVRKAGLRKAKA